MKKVFGVFGIIAGIAIIVMGIVVLNMNSGYSFLSSQTFGGDFYTYAYRGIKNASESIVKSALIVKKGLGFILIAIGATDICLFGVKLGEKNDSAKEKQDKTQQIADELPEI